MELDYRKKDGDGKFGNQEKVWRLADATIQYFHKYKKLFTLQSQFVNSIEYAYQAHLQGRIFSENEFITISCQIETIASELLSKTYPLRATDDFIKLQELLLDIEPPQPPSPCMFAPGSRQKIEVMRQRYENGYQVFHDDDFVEEKGVANYDGYIKLFSKIMEPSIRYKIDKLEM
ncbi:MAG: hypothetical protein KatS3mg087_0064 [Patescibacteria group bacterium]|nr:MAG: hypothetical protein KatS3mg087_0064 [Patescibacteria group bacterium]